MTPDLSPLGLSTSTKRIPIGICRRLVILLVEQNLTDAITSQGAIRIGRERFLILRQRTRSIALRHQLLSSQNRNPHLHFRRIFEDPVVRVDRNVTWPAK